jgi:hypothetical protein
LGDAVAVRPVEGVYTHKLLAPGWCSRGSDICCRSWKLVSDRWHQNRCRTVVRRLISSERLFSGSQPPSTRATFARCCSPVCDGADDLVGVVSGGPARPAVCPVVWSACRALRGASHTGVPLTPVKWRLTPGSRWMTMGMELNSNRSRSSRSATSRWNTRCYRSFAGHLIPALVVEDRHVLWIVRGSGGETWFHARRTLSVIRCADLPAGAPTRLMRR